MNYTDKTNADLLMKYADLIDSEYDPRSSYYGVIQEEKQVREEMLKRMEGTKVNADCVENKTTYDGMIEIDDTKMKVITRFVISLMRNNDLMYNCYIRGMNSEDDIDLMDVIAYLHEIIYQLYYHTPYRYMFHWANKVGSAVDEENIEMIINDILEEERGPLL